MKLILKRISTQIYRSDDLLELDLDALSLSGVDYWNQEVRCAKVKLLMDSGLEAILTGHLREIKAGFHTFAAFIYDDANTLLYTGVLPEASVSIEYLSLRAKTVELELMDYLGLVLELGADRIITLNESYINPVEIIPSIIGSILHPISFEPDTEAYSNADILRLLLCVGPVNYQYAHYSYDQTKWLPFRLVDHLLLDSKSIQYQHPVPLSHSISFGFEVNDSAIYLIYWQFSQRTGRNFIQHLRQRKYLVSAGNVSLVEETDEHNAGNNAEPWEIPEAPELLNMVSLSGEYHIAQGRAYYSGYTSLQSIEMVPGEYKAKDILGELLRISSAVLTVENYSFYIKNRQDDELPLAHFADPIEFELNPADTSAPELSAVAIASQAVIDAVNEHYRSILEASPFEARLKTHLYSQDISALGLSHPYALLNTIAVFDGYHIHPLQIAYDPITREIEISGRAK
ncbi:MAG: hypothetical protein PHC50_08555 [Candidatus Cloacimonetes bacterium]|nr:hypothetical protein [Candidatus Cloacimonadota bacterium]